MNAVLEERVRVLERQVAELTAEVARHRAPTQPAVTRYVPPVTTSTARWPLADGTPPIATARERLDVEDLLGGRLLALVGGLAVIVGITFFVGIAINHGWIDETARVALAATGSAALLAGGIWLYERKGRSQAALAMVGTAIAGMFLSLAAATALYSLIPGPVALPFALGIGALATAVAIRWDSRTVAALGIGGTLLTPVLGQSLTTPGMAFLAVATASAAAVLVWRRWAWLAVAASSLALGQVALWVSLDAPRGLELVVVLSVFALLNLSITVGYELRDASAVLQRPAALLIPFGALILGSVGYFGLPHAPGELAGGVWLVGLAVAHAVGAAVAGYLSRVNDAIALVLVGAAVALGDVAFGVLGNGWVLGLGWAGSALGLAILSRRSPHASDLVQLTLGGQLALAVGHVLLFDASPQMLSAGGTLSPGPTAALIAVIVAAFSSARLLVDERYATRIILDAVSMAALAYVTALTFDGTALLLAWAAAALALAKAGDRTDDAVARAGALAFLALTAGHILAVEAPPSALLNGLQAPLAAGVGLSLVAAVAVLCSLLQPRTDRQERALQAVAALALLYLVSTAIVTGFQPSSDALGAGAGVGVRQQGQALLSAFWGICGVTALWVGLRSDRRGLRLAGLGLLGLAATKVFMYDLSALGSLYRVGSFIALGLLLLAAAYVHQSLRAKSPSTPVDAV